MNNSLINILTEARDSLTLETWIKRDYFRSENKTICMCAHGAVQKIVNPKVKPYLEKLDISAAAAAALLAGAAASGAASASLAMYNVKDNPRKPLLKFWNERHDWIKEDCGYGIKDAHYLLGMVGLTINFNDDTNTTLDMVKDKFNEAIELAKLIENEKNYSRGGKPILRHMIEFFSRIIGI